MTRRLAIGALLVTLMAGQAGADVIATRTNTVAFTVSDGAVHLIPLNNTGGTFFSFFTLRDNERVVISFNAECSVKGPNSFKWLNIDILVDGVMAPPSSNDNAFCTSRGDNLLVGWVSAVTIVVFVVPDPGLHLVQVRGNLVGFGAGDQWRIDDIAVIVQQ